MHHRIVESLLQLVEAERGGEAVNRYLLKRAVDMLSSLRLYEDGVQETLLESAAQYYSREGSALINVGQGRMGQGCLGVAQGHAPWAVRVGARGQGGMPARAGSPRTWLPLPHASSLCRCWLAPLCWLAPPCLL